MERTARDRPRTTDEPVRRPEPPPHAGILGLQASAGNQAVAHLLQRQVTAPGKKKTTRLKLETMSQVVNGVYEHDESRVSELETLLKDADARTALNALIKNGDDFKVDDAGPLIARIRKDMLLLKADRKKDERKERQEKSKLEKEEASSSGTLVEQFKFVPSTTRGAVDALYNLCAPIRMKKDHKQAQQQSKQISGAITELKMLASEGSRASCLLIFGQLGNLEITEVCSWAGLSKNLSALERLLRERIGDGDDSVDEFLFKQLSPSLPWLTKELFAKVLNQRSGEHGTTSTSVQLTQLDLMRKYGEVIACAPLIQEVGLASDQCFKLIDYKPAELLGFTLLQKVIAGNVRRYKMATLSYCMKQFVSLVPLVLKHDRISPTAQEGVCKSLRSVFAIMNSKHLQRDVRQLQVLLQYLDQHPKAVCTNYSFKIKQWEFDLEMADDDGSFILEVESVPNLVKSPEALVIYILDRYKIKLDEAQQAFGEAPRLHLAIPGSVPEEVLSKVGSVVASSGASKSETPELDEPEDDGEK